MSRAVARSLAAALALLSPAVLSVGAANEIDGDGLTILALGDWGGETDAEPTTNSQRATAVGMMRLVRELNANLTLLMGDNIYEHGVVGRAQDSTRFRDTFESVYARLAPGHPFYAMAGNHDYGAGKMANVSAQLEYSQLSPHWNFPSLWYKLRREFKVDGQQTRSLDIFVLDTVILCGINDISEPFIDTQLRAVNCVASEGSEVGEYRRSVAKQQWAWLEAGLANSDADFLWVTGHYPLWSIGVDGSSPCLIQRLQPLLRRHGAHYISGHDHMLEHFEVDGLNTFVVGAGKECCYRPVNAQQAPAGSLRFMLAGEHGRLSQPPVPMPVLGGFASVHFGAEAASVRMHADDGAVLYTAPPIARRHPQAAARAKADSERLHADDGALLYAALPTAWWHRRAAARAKAVGAAIAAAAAMVGLLVAMFGVRRSCASSRRPQGWGTRPLLETDVDSADDGRPCGTVTFVE